VRERPAISAVQQTKIRRAVLSFMVSAVCCLGASAQEIHFSPEEDLAAIDAGLIAQAKHSIDFASYALTEGGILQALSDADRRGVTVRIVLDPRGHHDFAKLGILHKLLHVEDPDKPSQATVSQVQTELIDAVADALAGSTDLSNRIESEGAREWRRAGRAARALMKEQWALA